MTAETRDVLLWVGRWGASVHRPTTIARYEDLLSRFVTASIHPPEVTRRPPTSHTYVDLGELPLDDS